MAQKTKKKKLKNNKMKQDCRARSNFWLCLSANSGQLSRFPIKILQTINKYKQKQNEKKNRKKTKTIQNLKHSNINDGKYL